MEFSTHIRSDEVEIERRIREFLLGSDPVVIRYLDAITGNTGKRLRPKLVMVFARLFGEYDYGKGISCACAAELLHTATLIHDDVIDTAQFRRGSETLCNAFGNEIAVIVGDYLLAVVLDRVAKLRDFEVLDMFVGTSKKLGVGVLVEVNNRNNFKLAVDNYLSVIELKTAVLFELCTRLGAYLGGADAEGRKLAGEYGREFGMAFQIVDDLLDIAADPEKTGKPSFNDLKEGRITLPLIHAIGKDPSTELLMNAWQEEHSDEAADALKARLWELGSMDYSKRKAEEYLAKAREKSAKLAPRWASESARSDLQVIESGLFALLEGAGPKVAASE